MKFRMAIRVVLFLTLTGLYVADSTVVDTPSCPCVSTSRNLALGATAVQSYTIHGGEAQRAVDGNMDSYWYNAACTHTDKDWDPWWRVDLGQVYRVTRVSITNRGDCCAERINGAQIRIGNSLENNGNNNELAATVVSIPAGVTKTFDFKPIKGRYVNIVIPGRSEYLTLCEVEVFGEKYTPTCVPRNLALGATVVQSSTIYGGEAKRAVDGNMDSNWYHAACTHTSADRDPWWRVDLGVVYDVSRVNILNRGDAVPERINGAQIRIGNSLRNNGNNNELAATVESIPAGETKTFAFKPIKGRYVNIVIPGRKEYLTLCEVEVFADTSTYTCVPRNLALGATAVQSTTHGTHKAQNAVDGNRNGSCTHTHADWEPWWRVDLGEEYKVTRVIVTNRGDAAPERINGAQIRIGNSLENNGNNNELAEAVVSIPAGETKTFQFKPIKGRYVNIIIPGRNEHLHLCEVEVFADKVD